MDKNFFEHFEKTVRAFNNQIDKDKESQEKPSACSNDCQIACGDGWLLIKNNIINLNKVHWIMPMLPSPGKPPSLFFSLETNEDLDIYFDSIEEAKSALKFIFECL